MIWVGSSQSWLGYGLAPVGTGWDMGWLQSVLAGIWVGSSQSWLGYGLAPISPGWDMGWLQSVLVLIWVGSSQSWFWYGLAPASPGWDMGWLQSVLAGIWVGSSQSWLGYGLAPISPGWDMGWLQSVLVLIRVGSSRSWLGYRLAPVGTGWDMGWLQSVLVGIWVGSSRAGLEQMGWLLFSTNRATFWRSRPYKAAPPYRLEITVPVGSVLNTNNYTSLFNLCYFGLWLVGQRSYNYGHSHHLPIFRRTMSSVYDSASLFGFKGQDSKRQQKSPRYTWQWSRAAVVHRRLWSCWNLQQPWPLPDSWFFTYSPREKNYFLSSSVRYVTDLSYLLSI